MAGAGDELRAAPARAGGAGHALERAWILVDAPIALAGDEAGGHVDGAAGIGLELGRSPAGAAAIPLQPALEPGAPELAGIDGELAVGEPAAGSDTGGGRHLRRHRLGHAAV